MWIAASGEYKKCSLLASKFFIVARARKKIAVLACSQMLAKTIRHPSFKWPYCLIPYDVVICCILEMTTRKTLCND